MSAIEWGHHGVMTTEESTVLTRDDQQMWEIWSVEDLDTGTFVPRRLGEQFAATFAEAVQSWAELMEVEAYVDPLILSYNGLPLVSSRQEAFDLVQRHRRSQQ